MKYQITSFDLVKQMIEGPMPSNNACLEWPRAKLSSGYGILMHKGKCRKVHRIAVLLHSGELPESLDVLHHCDNPCCFRPSHLYLGTDVDNRRDTISRGRTNLPRGENHPKAKLKIENVLFIREELKRGQSIVFLANQFGVKPHSIRAIGNRTNWKHV